MKPGDVFGETAILSPGPRTASVVALDDVTLHIVTSDVLEAEVSSMKPWMGAFIHALAARFRESEQATRSQTTLRARPAFVAEQLLMRVLTWGRSADDGALVAYWSHLRTALAELFGVAGWEIDEMLAHFREIEIREDDDVVSIANPDRLKRAIRAELHREALD